MSDVEIQVPAVTIFGAPLWSPERSWDVVFLGVPIDQGMLGIRSTAGGPSGVRAASAIFPLASDADGTPVGWYDYVAGETILAGVDLADGGDFPVQRSRGAEQLDALPEVYAALAATTRLLVLLGGDHSMAFWSAKALDGEAIVWLDAHEDAADIQGPYPNHANVVSYVEREPGVPLILQYGLRGLITAGRRAPLPHRKICRTPEDVVAELTRHGITSVAFTIDVDVLDPGVFPSVSSPLPEGLTFAHLLALIRLVVASGVRVRLLEIAEFAPVGDGDRLPALSLVKFLLRAVQLCLTT